MSHRRRWIVALAAVLVASVGLPSAPPRVGAAGIQTLEDAVAAGLLDHRVVDAIRVGEVETVVSFAHEQILASTVGRSPAEVLEVVRPAFAAQRARALAGLPGGGRVVREFSHLADAVVAFRSEQNLLRVLQQPSVTGVRLPEVVQPTTAESLRLIRQPEAVAAGHAGSGIGIAVLDTGVDYTRPAFGGCTAPAQPATCRVVVARDFAPDDGARDTGNFHGTNVAGIAASVAPGARILALDVFGADGLATSADLMGALDWVIANRSAYNIRALNLSLGGGAHVGSCTPDPGFAEARAVGILPVVAAGNSGNAAGIAWPACVAGAVSVGAVYDASLGSRTYGSGCTDSATAPDKITCFSQSSGALTMLAPGASIAAAGLQMAGTSQATPHVAGAAAVLAAAAPGARVDTVHSALAGSGPTISDPRNGLARRRLDVTAALSTVGVSTSPTPTASPTPAPTPTPAPVVVDTAPPKVATVAPAANMTNVATGAAVSASFSEAVTGVSGASFQLRTKSTGALVSATVSYDAATRAATLRPSAALQSGISYTANLTTAIRDAAGNALAATTWSFTVAAGDTTPPSVTARTPSAGATGVATGIVPAATFGEAVSGVSATTVSLRVKSTNAVVATTIRYDSAKRMATITPTNALQRGISYVVSLGNAIRDAAGNPLPVTSWSFTTASADTARPTVLRTTPLAGATGVSRSTAVTATFSEPVGGVSGTSMTLKLKSTGQVISGTVSYDATSRIATLRPTSALRAGTSYVVYLSSAVKDAAGNQLLGVSWSFTTGAQ